MKTPFLITALRHGLLLLLLACTLHALPGAAQTPQYMTYQGYLTDQSGNALGTNGPQNYDIVFRIWNQPTGASGLIYGELQTVTVANGYFSVLLGQGTPYVSGGVTDPRPPLSTVFTTNNGSSTARYVEMTVKGLASGSDVTILPRLQLVSAPYAFMAANANALVSATTGANIISSSGANLSINGSLTNTGGSIYMDNAQEIYAKNSSGVYESVLWPRWSDNVTYLNYGSAGFNIRNDSSVSTMWMGNNGTVGIGTTSPLATLHVFGNADPALLVDSPLTSGTWDVVRNTSPGGVSWQMISTGSGNGEGAGKLLFDYGSVPGTTSGNVMTLAPGAVGIGTTAPDRLLSVNGTADFVGGIKVSGSSNPYMTISDGTAEMDLGLALSTGNWSSGALAHDTVMRNIGGKIIIQSGSASPGITVTTGNLVGIGTASPTENLTVAGVGSYNNGLKLTGNTVNGTGMALESTATGGRKYDLISGGSSSGEGAGAFEIYDESVGGFRLTILPSGFVGINNTAPTTWLEVGSATCNGSTWINSSDRNLKQDFAAVNTAAVLAKVVSLPVQSWVYKTQTDEKHIGPVAQDFHAAFGLNGGDDKHISTVDESGVALAAIQGLNSKVEEQNADKAALTARLEKLEARETHMDELEQEVADLKKMVAQLARAGKDAKLAAEATPGSQAQRTLTTASLDH